MSPSPAALLSQLIEFGYCPEPNPCTAREGVGGPTMTNKPTPPAAILSRLIEFGYAPEPETLPFEWRVAYEAVKLVRRRSRHCEEAEGQSLP